MVLQLGNDYYLCMENGESQIQGGGRGIKHHAQMASQRNTPPSHVERGINKWMNQSCILYIIYHRTAVVATRCHQQHGIQF